MRRKSTIVSPVLNINTYLGTPQLSRSTIRLVYERNEHVQSSVNELVRKISTARWWAVPDKIRKFLLHPCTEKYWQNFVATIVTDLLLYNSVALEKVYSYSGRKLLELVPISTENLELKYSDLGIPSHWVWKPPYTTGLSESNEVEFSLDELYVIVLYPSIDRKLGISPVESIVDQVTILIEKWHDKASEVLEPGVPYGVFLLTGTTGPDDFERIREELGSDDPLKLLMTEGKGQWIEFKNRLSTDDFLKLVDAAKEIVYDVFGKALGRSEAGVSSRLASIQARGSDDSMLIPLCMTISNALTDIFQNVGGRVIIWPREFSDSWRESRTLKNLIEGEIISKEEARMFLDFPVPA